jgi:protein gp37
MSARRLPGLMSPTTGEPFARPFGFPGSDYKKPRWTGRVELIESQLGIPLHWRKPRRIFVNSMSDTFHEALPDATIDRIFAVMALCPQHTFLCLTKRPERMREWFSEWRKPDDSGGGFEPRWCAVSDAEYAMKGKRVTNGWPLPNVWLGVSAEDQATADERIPLLLQTPAVVRFISAEPLLSAIDFSRYMSISLIIVGGESGPGARPMHPDWVRNVRDQCEAARVPLFFKQQGEWQFGSSLKASRNRILLNDGTLLKPDAEDATCEQRNNWRRYQPTMVARVGKRATGRLLDGVEHNGMPEARG